MSRDTTARVSPAAIPGALPSLAAPALPEGQLPTLHLPFTPCSPPFPYPLLSSSSFTEQMPFLRTGSLTESYDWKVLRAKPLPAQKPLCSITEGDPQPQVAGILPGMGSSLAPQGHPSHSWAAWTPRSYHLIFSSKSAFPKIPFTDLSPIFRKFYMSAGAWGSRDEMRVCPHAQGATDHSGGRQGYEVTGVRVGES